MKELLIYYIENKKLYEYNTFFLNKVSSFVKEICVISNINIPVDELPSNVSKVIVSKEAGSTFCYEKAVASYEKEELLKFNYIIFSNSDLFGPLNSPDLFFKQIRKTDADVYYLEDIYVNSVSHYLFSVKSVSITNDKYNLLDIINKKTDLTYSSFFEDSVPDYYISKVTGHIINKNSPFIFKDILTENPGKLLQNSLGLSPTQIMEFIKSETNYPENFIWDYLIENTPMSILRNNFHHNYILPSTLDISKPTESTIALICYIYYEELIDYCYNYSLSMPDKADIYIITCNSQMTDLCKKKFTKFPCHKLSVRQMENRGRDVAAYLVAAKDIFYKYDYICCMHDKKSPQYTPTVSNDFSYHLFESNLTSKQYVKNIISTFDQNKKLGMLIPLFPYFGNGLHTIGNQMHTEGEKVKSLLNKLKFHVPYDLDVCAPLGTMFWVKGKAFLPIFNYDWKHEDFPQEPNKSSGTILHAIERFYPFAVQEAGYFVGTVSPEKYTAIYLDNLYWKMKEKVQQNLQETVQEIHFRDVKSVVKNYLRKKTRKLFSVSKKIEKVAYIRYLEKKNDKILIHLLTDDERCILKLKGKDYYPVLQSQNVCNSLRKKLNDVYAIYHFKGVFFELPLSEILNLKISLYSSKGQQYKLQFNGPILYSAITLSREGVFSRIYDKNIYFESKKHFYISVFKGLKYSIRDKLIFILLMFNFIHKNILFSENGNATDNSFELFKHSLINNKNSYFVASKKIYRGIKDKKLKQHILRYNSFRHLWKIIFSKFWITSYTLSAELFPKSKVLKDIHFYNIPGKWFFVPHGITGDKDSIMVHKYCWDAPDTVFASGEFEQKSFINNCGFSKVAALGYPRMDKWHVSDLNCDKILIFFTWRLKWNEKKMSETEFLSSHYFRTISSIIEMLSSTFPKKKLFYVIHHEVERKGFDKIIRDKFSKFNISYISFSTPDGGSIFNAEFKTAKYLITDYSSVAYDFGYKKDAVPIYYLNEDFISGHYPLLPIFNKIHLGIVSKNIGELKNILKGNYSRKEIEKRRANFFKYFDDKNSERILNYILKKE